MISLTISRIRWVAANINIIKIGWLLGPLEPFSKYWKWVRIITQNIIAKSSFQIIWRRIIYRVDIKGSIGTLLYRITAFYFNWNFVRCVWHIHWKSLIRLVKFNPVGQLIVVIIYRGCPPRIDIFLNLSCIIAITIWEIRVNICNCCKLPHYMWEMNHAVCYWWSFYRF